MTDMDDAQITKKCPFCGEQVHIEAIKCRFCREFLEDKHGLPVSHHTRQKPPAPPAEKPSPDNPPKTMSVSPSLWGLLGTLCACGTFYILGIAFLFSPMIAVLKNSTLPQGAKENLFHVLQVAGLAILFIDTLIILYKILRLKSVHYEISTDRIEWVRGIMSRKIDNVDMFRIVDIRLHRSLTDCLLGIGAIVLTTKDKNQETFEMEKVKKPKAVYDFIKTASLSADRKQGIFHIE